MRPAVELVSTGSELLSGRTVNRHAHVLGDHLHHVGLTLVRDTTVPDDIGAIQEAVRGALSRVDVVIVSGGLGPTCDDVTRDAIAGMFGRKVVMDPDSLTALRGRYAKIERPVTPQAGLQAQVVEGATALSNSAGAAPGQRLEIDHKTLFILPGPPSEFLAVLRDHVMPWLSENFRHLRPVAEKMFLLCGVGESDIMVKMEQAGVPSPGIDVAYCAAAGRVELRFTLAGGDAAVIEKAASDVRELFGAHIFAEERLEMEEVVGRLLRRHGKTLATAESCTGGLIGHRLTGVSGSSDYYRGGVVAYSNDAKVDLLGVDPAVLETHGAVSAEVAGQMAEGVRKKLGADIAVSVTGVAGPTGGTDEKPVGLVFIAVADASGVRAKRFQFIGDRGRIKEWSSQMALDRVRRLLIGALKDDRTP